MNFVKISKEKIQNIQVCSKKMSNGSIKSRKEISNPALLNTNLLDKNSSNLKCNEASQYRKPINLNDSTKNKNRTLNINNLIHNIVENDNNRLKTDASSHNPPQNSSQTSSPNFNVNNSKNISENLSNFSDEDDYEESLHGIAKMRQKYIDNPQISYLNVNSLRNKIHDIRNLTSQISPTILAISETKIDNSFPDSQFFIENYQNPNEYRKDRTKDGGGLITFIKNGIPCRRISKMEPPDLEIMCIEIDFGRRKWAIISVYRQATKQTPKIFFEGLGKCVEKVTNSYDNIIIMGDMNINVLNKDSYGYLDYESFLDTFNLKNLIKKTTCHTKTASSSLDVLLTNRNRLFFNTIVLETGISDVHCLVGTTLRATYKRAEPNIIQYRDYKKFDQFSFLDDLGHFEEDKCVDDPNILYENFLSFFQKTVEKHAPIKQKILRGNDKGFADKTLRKAWYKRSRLRNKFNKNKTTENWELFKKQRNKCTSLKRKALSRYFEKKKDSSKSFWKTFGPYLSSRGHIINEDIILSENNEIERERKKVGEIFNTHFINIIENSTGIKPETFECNNENDIIEEICNKYISHESIIKIKEKMRHEQIDSFKIKEATYDEVYDIINKLKANVAPGYDKIPSKLIKLSAQMISEPLRNIINSSIKNESFPDLTKIAVVNPIYKNPDDGSKLNKKHYRPISILNGFSKIFERYYLNQMLVHVDKILSKYISAYRKGHSCQNVLLKLTEEWRENLDQNKVVGALLIDLSKAFDCLPHDLLIAKLDAYGFEKQTTNLLYSYLTKRKQGVKIKDTISDFLDILSGVPQGSILGPILFNIFISDMFLFTKSTNPNNFADDNTLSASENSIDKLVKTLETGGQEAIDWLTQNKMIPNPDKFKAIVLKRNRTDTSNISLKINNKEIKTSTWVKLLGIKLDNRLSFQLYISEMCKAAGAKLNAIKRLGTKLNEHERKLLIDAHVISYLNYCSTVWHFCGKVEIHKIEKLHERCIRFIYNDYTLEYFELLKNKNSKTLYAKRVSAMCCEIYKTKNTLNAGYMSDLLSKRPSNYPTRRENDLYIPKANFFTFGYNSYRVKGPKHWNNLQENTKTATSLNCFKKFMKKENIPFCVCENCIEKQNSF